MRQITTAIGRIYEIADNLYLPSMTTVLKDTDPDPFDQKVWLKSLTRKGLTEHCARIYMQRFEAAGMPPHQAWDVVSGLVDTGMSKADALAYMEWKTPHSSDRGDRLHKALETILPGHRGIEFEEPPEVEEADTNLLLRSIHSSGALSLIDSVVSVEERMYYFRNGMGIAGSEDICYRTPCSKTITADYKTKDPKPYRQEPYAAPYKLQVVGYAAMRTIRKGMTVDECHIHYPFSDGSPSELVVVEKPEMKTLWAEVNDKMALWFEMFGVERILEAHRTEETRKKKLAKLNEHLEAQCQ